MARRWQFGKTYEYLVCIYRKVTNLSHFCFTGQWKETKPSSKMQWFKTRQYLLSYSFECNFLFSSTSTSILLRPYSLYLCWDFCFVFQMNSNTYLFRHTCMCFTFVVNDWYEDKALLWIAAGYTYYNRILSLRNRTTTSV